VSLYALLWLLAVLVLVVLLVQPVSRNRGSRETAERQQSLKRDPNPGSGHIIALGRLNHWAGCCQMLRTYLTNREAEQ